LSVGPTPWLGALDDQNLMATDLVPLVAQLVNAELTWDVAGRVSVQGFDLILDDAAGSSNTFVQGIITSDTTAVELLVAVDGTVVSGSMVYPTDQGSGFIAMLPSRLRGQDVVLDIVLVDSSDDQALASVESR
jgi:hypothetical protein